MMANTETTVENIVQQVPAITPEKPKRAHLFMHNHDNVSFQQVWNVLHKVTHHSAQEIVMLAAKAHSEGKVVIFSASLDLVETKLQECRLTAKIDGCPQLPFSAELD